VEIATEKAEGIIFLTLATDSLDASNTDEFKQTVAGSVEPKAKIVLDLGQVDFIDSSGCGAILGLLRQLNEAGGELKLCSVTKAVRSLFELIRLHKILDLYDSREAAAQAFQAAK
jgi:anti-sigma B factor antagonist